MDEVRFIVIGIGININNDKKALVGGATSLREYKKENISRIELLQEILRKIEANYLIFQEKGAQPIIEKWRAHNVTLNRRVRVLLHGKQLEAEALDIDTDGGLLLRKDSGIIQKVTAGDVIHCR
jgi:BirA family biotin operon repressor/biotin-[acetyl-CoA-carboxylase] ligase